MDFRSRNAPTLPAGLAYLGLDGRLHRLNIYPNPSGGLVQITLPGPATGLPSFTHRELWPWEALCRRVKR